MLALLLFSHQFFAIQRLWCAIFLLSLAQEQLQIKNQKEGKEKRRWTMLKQTIGE
jgi:hypothetical protein